MEMSYSKNPNLPKVRAEAVKMLRSGHSTREVARYFGYNQSTIVRWNRKVHPEQRQFRVIPTGSSKPYSHPASLRPEVVKAILGMRHETGRGAEFIHHVLMAREGLAVSLSSVKRTLKRNNLTKYSSRKRWHQYPPRPLPDRPGELVQVDTVHRMAGANRLYVYTLLDVYSRWAYAAGALRIGAAPSAGFIKGATLAAPFVFRLIQSDHGPEFSRGFTASLAGAGINHRHSRVRTPNDNAHLERFNRTLQEELIRHLPADVAAWNRQLPQYLRYYNSERPHMGLGWKTPMEMLQNQT